jgi:hypothetical protein
MTLRYIGAALAMALAFAATVLIMGELHSGVITRKRHPEDRFYPWDGAIQYYGWYGVLGLLLVIFNVLMVVFVMMLIGSVKS